MVSVPWVTITPATPDFTSWKIARARSCQMRRVMFSERMEEICSVRNRPMDARSGIARRISSAENWLVTAPVR